MNAMLVALLIGLMGWPTAVRAELGNVSASGFVSSFRDEVQATPDAVWKAIVQLPRWWHNDHTWSGKASNMVLELQAGDCWCERWGGGQSVQHGVVTLVQPGRVIRLQANLGPLHELPVHAVLTIATGAQDGKTFLRLTYRVAGPADTGLDRLAPAVDQVLGAQYKRLKVMVETGKPE